MLLRTPVAPLLLGPFFQLGGVALAEVSLAVWFAVAVAAVVGAAASISRRLALAAAVVLLAYPSTGALYHQYSSDPYAGLGTAVLLLLATRASLRPSPQGFALLGSVVALLVLVRPANQVLLALVLFPLALTGPWRARLLLATAFAVTAAALLAGWALHNYLRYEDFTIARTGAAQLPLNRAFRVERIVSPDNGPVSRELGELVRRNLLSREPYRSYGVTEEQFWRSGSSRMYYDLYGVSNEAWGWHSDYAKLRSVGIEAVRAHPGLYVWGVARTIRDELVLPYQMRSGRRASRSGAEPRAAETIVVAGRRLPKPSEGEPIPASRDFWLHATPDHRIWDDWSDVAHPVTRYRYPEDARRVELVSRRVAEWNDAPSRDGVGWLSSLLNGITAKLPPAAFWLLLGLPSLTLWALPQVRALAAIAGASLLVIAATALSQPTTLEFALPFQPVFVLFGLTGAMAIWRLLRRARRHAGARAGP